MAQPRLRKCATEQEFERTIDDLSVQGYEIQDRGEMSVLMREKRWGTGGGHALVALLTVWWTLGIGNLIYAVVAHFTAPKVMLKLDIDANAGQS